MGKIAMLFFKVAKTFLYGPTFLIFCYLIFLSIASWHKGYSWSEMDWNQKGYTSVVDFLVAGDIGKREIQVNGELCTEFYAYKDGLSVKTICPKYQ